MCTREKKLETRIKGYEIGDEGKLGRDVERRERKRGIEGLQKLDNIKGMEEEKK